MTTTEQLAAYRRCRAIAWEWSFGPTPSTGLRQICAHDGIRVVPRFGRKLGQGWRHDPDEIRRLVKATR